MRRALQHSKRVKNRAPYDDGDHEKVQAKGLKQKQRAPVDERVQHKPKPRCRRVSARSTAGHAQVAVMSRAKAYGFFICGHRRISFTTRPRTTLYRRRCCSILPACEPAQHATAQPAQQLPAASATAAATKLVLYSICGLGSPQGGLVSSQPMNIPTSHLKSAVTKVPAGPGLLGRSLDSCKGSMRTRSMAAAQSILDAVHLTKRKLLDPAEGAQQQEQQEEEGGAESCPPAAAAAAAAAAPDAAAVSVPHLGSLDRLLAVDIASAHSTPRSKECSAAGGNGKAQRSPSCTSPGACLEGATRSRSVDACRSPAATRPATASQPGSPAPSHAASRAVSDWSDVAPVSWGSWLAKGYGLPVLTAEAQLGDTGSTREPVAKLHFVMAERSEWPGGADALPGQAPTPWVQGTPRSTVAGERTGSRQDPSDAQARPGSTAPPGPAAHTACGSACVQQGDGSPSKKVCLGPNDEPLHGSWAIHDAAAGPLQQAPPCPSASAASAAITAAVVAPVPHGIILPPWPRQPAQAVALDAGASVTKPAAPSLMMRHFMAAMPAHPPAAAPHQGPLPTHPAIPPLRFNAAAANAFRARRQAVTGFKPLPLHVDPAAGSSQGPAAAHAPASYCGLLPRAYQENRPPANGL